MLEARETIKELVFPRFILLLKIAEMLIEKSNAEGVSFTEEEFKEAIKNVVIEYCCEAWDEGRMPLYIFKSQWKSPDLERDLQILFRHFVTCSSAVTLTERGIRFLENYNDTEVLSYYYEKLEKIVDKIIQMKKA
jgi:hypothetical protein